jgi:hypothetical protein
MTLAIARIVAPSTIGMVVGAIVLSVAFAYFERTVRALKRRLPRLPRRLPIHSATLPSPSLLAPPAAQPNLNGGQTRRGQAQRV